MSIRKDGFRFYTNAEPAKAKAQGMVTVLGNAADNIGIISQYILRSVFYNHLLAFFIRGKRVTSYKPNLGKALKTGKGICSDYAWLFAVMLKAVGIKCRVVYGMADKTCHAWNEVMIDGKWTLWDLSYQQSGKQVQEYKPQVRIMA